MIRNVCFFLKCFQYSSINNVAWIFVSKQTNAKGRAKRARSPKGSTRGLPAALRWSYTCGNDDLRERLVPICPKTTTLSSTTAFTLLDTLWTKNVCLAVGPKDHLIALRSIRGTRFDKDKACV